MKTAMQKHLEWLKARIVITPQMEEALLQEEKKHIIDAFGVGCQVESTRLIGYQGMAEQYYLKTYKQD